MTTIDAGTNSLHRDCQRSNKFAELESQQSSVSRLKEQLHSSTPRASSCAHKVPIRKSSKTFSKVADEVLVSTRFSEPPPNTGGAASRQTSEQRRSSIFRCSGTLFNQAMTVPRRTTSLREPLKSRRRPDLVFLHSRGRGLFSSIDDMLALAQEPTPRGQSFESQELTRQGSASLDSEASYATRRSIFAPEYLASTTVSKSRPVARPRQSDGPPFCTTISWTSDETRLTEYNKIDRAHSGLRGFCKALLPKSWCKGGRRDFFNGECDGDSVRRYRLSLPGKIGAAMIRDRNWSCF